MGLSHVNEGVVTRTGWSCVNGGGHLCTRYGHVNGVRLCE